MVSVSQYHHVMIGFKISPDDFDAETWKEIYEEYGYDNKSFHIILCEGIDDEYAIFGKVISESNQYHEMSVGETDFYWLNNYKDMVEKKYYEIFDDADQEARLFCVTHWC